MGCTDLSESTLVKMPHCWKSHVVAQLSLNGSLYDGRSMCNSANSSILYDNVLEGHVVWSFLGFRKEVVIFGYTLFE